MSRKNPNRSKIAYLKLFGLAQCVKYAFNIRTKGRIQPSIALGMPRAKAREVTLRAMRTIHNQQRHAQNVQARRKLQKETTTKEAAKRKTAVNTMTNWQRNQWARAGYPKNLKTIRTFAKMEGH